MESYKPFVVQNSWSSSLLSLYSTLEVSSKTVLMSASIMTESEATLGSASTGKGEPQVQVASI